MLPSNRIELIRNTIEISFVMNDQGDLLAVNQPFAESVGASIESLVNQPMTRFFDEPLCNDLRNHWPVSDLDDSPLFFEGVLKSIDGSIINVTGWGGFIRSDEDVFIGFCEEKKHTSASTLQSFQIKLSCFSKITSSLIHASEKNFDSVMISTLQRVVTFLKMERATMYEVDFNEKNVRSLYQWGSNEIDSLDVPNKVAINLSDEELEHLNHLRQLKFFSKNDLSGNSALEQIYSMSDIETIMVVPLIKKDHLFGWMMFDSLTEDLKISALDFRFIETLSDVIGGAMMSHVLERKAKESEFKYVSLIENMNEVLYTMDPDLVVTYITRNIEQLLGYTNKEVVGQKFLKFLDPTIHVNAEHVHWASISNRDRLEFCFRHKNGQSVWIKTQIRMHTKDNEVLYSQGVLFDITEQKRTSESLVASEERYRLLMTQMQDGMAIHEVILDEEGQPVDYMFLDVNESYEQITGLKRSSILGKTVREVIPEIEESWIKKFGHVALTEIPAQFEDYSKVLKRWFRVSVYSPKFKQFAVIVEDITENKERMELIEHLSYHDELTQLYNRRFIEESIRRLDTPRNYPLAIIMLDVNDLKKVNDQYGHYHGDQLLKIISMNVKDLLRQDDLLGRMGGDEFLIVLPKTDQKSVERIMGRLHQISDELQINGVNVSLAGGYAIKTEASQDMQSILVEADNQMYLSKRSMKTKSES